MIILIITLGVFTTLGKHMVQHVSHPILNVWIELCWSIISGDFVIESEDFFLRSVNQNLTILMAIFAGETTPYYIILLHILWPLPMISQLHRYIYQYMICF